ncbi:MAG: 4-hydroxythreonine-4-phosphate dehydrogenase PdxA, partial [Endomicrobiia bacterium]
MHGNSYLIFTMGDPEGIGPEIIAKSFIQKPFLFRRIIPIVVGNTKILKKYACDRFPVVSIDSIEVAKKYKGKLCVIDIQKNLSSGRLSIEYINCALDIIKKNKYKIPLITAPVSKEKIIKEGINFPGHTEYLAKKTGTKKVAMLMISKKYKILLATRHIPLKEVTKKLNSKILTEEILNLSEHLQKNKHDKNSKRGLILKIAY